MTTTAPPVRIVVADDHQVVRAGFAGLLDTQPDFTVVGTAADGAEAVRICRELDPDVVLMDVRMPGMDGIEATRQLAHRRDRPPARPHPDHVRPGRVRLRRAARRSQRLPAQGRHRRAALRRRARHRRRRGAARPGRHPPPHQRVRPASAQNRTPAPTTLSAALTPRETQVLRLVAEGLSNPRSPPASSSPRRR